MYNLGQLHHELHHELYIYIQSTVVTPDQKSVTPKRMAVTPKKGKPVTT
jgi:hypothetical protein